MSRHHGLDATEPPFPHDLSIHDLFEFRVARGLTDFDEQDLYVWLVRLQSCQAQIERLPLARRVPTCEEISSDTRWGSIHPRSWGAPAHSEPLSSGPAGCTWLPPGSMGKAVPRLLVPERFTLQHVALRRHRGIRLRVGTRCARRRRASTPHHGRGLDCS